MTDPLVEAPEKHCSTCRCFAPRRKVRSGLKRDAADARWSKMVRDRAGMWCQFVEPGELTDHTGLIRRVVRCGLAVGRGLSPQGLHAAHCFTRGNPRTRLDPDNGLAMCWPHHREIDGDKSLRYFVFRHWLGDERFEALEARAKGRRDR